MINQIRLQAEQINNLIAQLEAVQRSQGQPPNLENASAILQSPAVSSSGDSFDEPGAVPNIAPVVTEGNRAIEDWLAQAKESFLQFGNSISKNYGSDEDEDSADWEDDDYDNVDHSDLEGYGGDGGYDFAVEQPENDAPQEYTGQRLRSHASNSSLNTTTASVAGSATHPRKKKPANLPSEAAPWGLIAKLNINNRASSMDPEDTGLASSKYFTGKSSCLLGSRIPSDKACSQWDRGRTR